MKLFLFADDIILYGENQRIHTQKTVRVNRQVQQSYKIQNKCTKINVMFRLAMNNKKCNYKEFNL